MHCTTSASESTETRKATVQSRRFHDLSENTVANAITQNVCEDDDCKYLELEPSPMAIAQDCRDMGLHVKQTYNISLKDITTRK